MFLCVFIISLLNIFKFIKFELLIVFFSGLHNFLIFRTMLISVQEFWFSGITPGDARGPYGTPRIEPEAWRDEGPTVTRALTLELRAFLFCPTHKATPCSSWPHHTLFIFIFMPCPFRRMHSHSLCILAIPTHIHVHILHLYTLAIPSLIFLHIHAPSHAHKPHSQSVQLHLYIHMSCLMHAWTLLMHA